MATVAIQIRAKSGTGARQEYCTTSSVAAKERNAGKESNLMRKPPKSAPVSRTERKNSAKTSKTQAVAASPAKPARRVKKIYSQESSPMPATVSLPEIAAAPQMPLVPELPAVAEELQSIPVNALPSGSLSKEEEDRFAARDRVVLENLPLVRVIAVRVHENLPVHVDLDDLIHAGIMGLFDAATKFDPEKNVVFSSYAKHRIKGAILDSLRQLDWASRDLRRRHKQVEQVTRDLAGELHRNPTEAEVASRMGVEVDRWRQMMLDLRNVGLVSASSRAQDSEDMPAPDFPTHPDHHPDTMCAKEELKSLLKTAMQTLPERYQRVVLLYYSNELTMKEIGSMLGINESRVSQIHKAALEKMANALGQAGISSAAAF
jgi:RNA polymerase sigma factor for flagellar operon FliA